MEVFEGQGAAGQLPMVRLEPPILSTLPPNAIKLNVKHQTLISTHLEEAAGAGCNAGEEVPGAALPSTLHQACRAANQAG